MGLFDLGKMNKILKPVSVAGVKKSSRFIDPETREIDEWRVKYKNAQDLAKDLGDIPKGHRSFIIVDGQFVFGDLLHTLIVQNDYFIKELTISTLSLGLENIDSMRFLLDEEYVDKLNLILSTYFFGHERHPGGLLPYLYEKLDIDDRLQVAIASVHTKIALFETECGKKIIFHGSANLRSSANIEQLVIEESEGLYDFLYDMYSKIIDKHKTINKDCLRDNQLWATIIGEYNDRNPIKYKADTAWEKPSVLKRIQSEAAIKRERQEDLL